MDKKRLLLFVLLAGILIVTVLLIPKGNKEEKSSSETREEDKVTEKYVDILEDGTKLNNSKELEKSKKFQGLTIKNIQLTNANNKTELIADIENTTGKDTEAMLIDVVFKDKEGKEITTLGGRISPIKAGATMQFSTSAMMDYANAFDFEFKLK